MDSRFIEHRLNELRDRKSKKAFLESLFNDPMAVMINEWNGHKTTIFPGSKGPKTKTWRSTTKMASELNKVGIDVVFLSEVDGAICADSVLRIGDSYRIADFKYCITTKANTIAKELEHGFLQAGMVVMKLPMVDSGTFKDALKYLVRNEIPYGDIILVNEYGKTLTITYMDIKRGKYVRKIKGFL